MQKANFKQKYYKQIFNLAEKHNLTMDQVVNIYFDQFKFVKESIRLKEKVSIKLKGFGTFVYQERKDKKIKELYERKILSKGSSKDGNRDQSDQSNGGCSDI